MPRNFKPLNLLQQDGARLHTSNETMAFLDGVFGPRVLSDRAIRGHPWAPNSPDLTPCDFWLHGQLKVVYNFFLCWLHKMFRKWNNVLQANIYGGLPPTLQHLERAAEHFFGQLNNNHRIEGRSRGRCCVWRRGREPAWQILVALPKAGGCDPVMWSSKVKQ